MPDTCVHHELGIRIRCPGPHAMIEMGDVQRESEIKHYLARVEAERLSQQQPDDESADAARLGVEDIVPLR